MRRPDPGFAQGACPGQTQQTGGSQTTGKLLPDIVAPLLGRVIAGGVLYLIASGTAGFDVAAGFASNGHGEHSPGKYSMFATLLIEVVMTMVFLIIIMGSTDKRAGQPRSAVVRLRPAARRVEPPSG